jgi:hypothetical protein
VTSCKACISLHLSRARVPQSLVDKALASEPEWALSWAGLSPQPVGSSSGVHRTPTPAAASPHPESPPAEVVVTSGGESPFLRSREQWAKAWLTSALAPQAAASPQGIALHVSRKGATGKVIAGRGHSFGVARPVAAPPSPAVASGELQTRELELTECSPASAPAAGSEGTSSPISEAVAAVADARTPPPKLEARVKADDSSADHPPKGTLIPSHPSLGLSRPRFAIPGVVYCFRAPGDDDVTIRVGTEDSDAPRKAAAAAAVVTAAQRRSSLPHRPEAFAATDVSGGLSKAALPAAGLSGVRRGSLEGALLPVRSSHAPNTAAAADAGSWLTSSPAQCGAASQEILGGSPQSGPARSMLGLSIGPEGLGHLERRRSQGQGRTGVETAAAGASSGDHAAASAPLRIGVAARAAAPAVASDDEGGRGLPRTVGGRAPATPAGSLSPAAPMLTVCSPGDLLVLPLTDRSWRNHVPDMYLQALRQLCEAAEAASDAGGGAGAAPPP